MSVVRGHGLMNEGAPFRDDGTREDFGSALLGTSGVGRPKCSCGELGPRLPSASQRKKWHRRHKDSVMHGARAFVLVGEHPADRLMSHQSITSEVNLHGDPPPTRNQVAAVLRALADHTHSVHLLSDDVFALGADDMDLGEVFARASAVDRYFHGLADHLVRR